MQSALIRRWPAQSLHNTTLSRARCLRQAAQLVLLKSQVPQRHGLTEALGQAVQLVLVKPQLLHRRELAGTPGPAAQLVLVQP